MQPMRRVQDNIVSRHERRLIDRLCRLMPDSVTSDHLTILGVFGAVMVLAGYIAGRADPRFLWVSAAGYLVNWLGDSLDGSLARHRNVTRPRYGYFLDHSVDALCIFMMIGGLGLSSYVRMDVALFAVMGYFALSIHVFLKNHVTGMFQLSFMALGPTELRMIFVGFTLTMLAVGHSNGLAGALVSDFDLALLAIGGAFMGLFTVSTASMVLRLRALEGNGRGPALGTPIGPRNRIAASGGVMTAPAADW